MGLFDLFNKKKKERELQEQLRSEAKDSKVHTTSHLLFLKEIVSDAFFAYRHVTNTSKNPSYMWAEKELYLGDKSKFAHTLPFLWIRTLAKKNVPKFNETMNLLNNEYQINVQGLDVEEIVQRIKRNGFSQFKPDFDVNVNQALLIQLYKDSSSLLKFINFFGDNIDQRDISPSQSNKVNIPSASPEINEIISDMVNAYRIGLFEPSYGNKDKQEPLPSQQETDVKRSFDEQKKNAKESCSKYGKLAETIINELRGSGMLNSVAIMERAVKLYNDNSNVTSLSQVQNVIESLFLFVKAYQLDRDENKKPGSVMKCKILMFIALCNYKIDNINRAYCIARQGNDAIDEAIENSMFAGMPRSMYGQDTIYELLEAIENTRHDEVVNWDNYDRIDPEEIDTTRFEDITRMIGSGARNDRTSNIAPVDRDFILNVINKYDDLRGQLVFSSMSGNKQAAMILMMIHEFVCPIFYAWEYWGYGKMKDLWKEDFAIIAYERFKQKNILQEIKKSYSSISGFFPFKSVDYDGSLKAATMAILKNLIEELER